MNLKIYLRGLLIIAVLVVLAYLFEAISPDKAWVDAQVRDRGLLGIVLFVAVAGAGTSVGLPRQVVAFLGGYGFGFLAGAALSLAAAVIGCVTAFSYARLFGRKLLTGRMPERVRRMDAFFQENPFSMALLMRLLPLGSNLLINLSAGISGVRALPFVAGSALGYIPQMAIFALIGSGIGVDPVQRIGVGAVLFVVAGGIGVHLYRRYRHGLDFDAEIGRELEANGAASSGARGD